MIQDFITAFTLIFFAELLDKTQLVVISLSAKYSKIRVFIASSLALILMTIISAIIGQVIQYYIPILILKVVSGIIFIAFGVFLLKPKKKHEKEKEINITGNVTLKIFLLTFIAELGDKTQISVILVSTVCDMVILVVIGAALAFIVITLIGVLLGSTIKVLLGERKRIIDIVSSGIFIFIGLWLLISTF